MLVFPCKSQGFHPVIRDQYFESLVVGHVAEEERDVEGLRLRDVLAEVVSSRPQAAGYRIELRDNAVVEQRVPTRYLGS